MRRSSLPAGLEANLRDDAVASGEAAITSVAPVVVAIATPEPEAVTEAAEAREALTLPAPPIPSDPPAEKVLALVATPEPAEVEEESVPDTVLAAALPAPAPAPSGRKAKKKAKMRPVAPVSEAPTYASDPVRADRTTADDVSIPPIGDLAVEEFFSEGDVSARLADDPDEMDDERITRKRHPKVIARRAKLARYVTWAVGSAAVVCLAAFARGAWSGAAEASGGRNALGAAVTAPLVPPPPPPAAPAPVVEAPAPVEDIAPAAPTKTAAEEKNDARNLLERGKTADAVEAGLRSVALDAEDGESWLILGAAYQERGNLVEARKCYAECVAKGKRGPRGECAAMLR